MSDTLKSLLKEYEQKRMAALTSLDKRVAGLYSSNKRLEEIDNELNMAALNTAKLILSTSNSSYVEDLQNKINSLKKEKKQILDTLKIDDSFFKPNFECSLCEDTGYVRDGDSFNLCSCIKQKLFDIKYNKSNIGNLEKDNFNNFDFNLFSDIPDEELYNSDISPRENMQNIKDIAENFINNFDDANEKNLLFTGNSGLGKTFLSNCIANELLKKDKNVLYQTAPFMLDTIINAKFNNNLDGAYENILNVDLLIIDDLGTEFMNSMKFSELFNIINSRSLNQNNHITKTIISTNLNPQELSAKYDERIMSRFIGYYNICRFFGEDIRLKK